MNTNCFRALIVGTFFLLFLGGCATASRESKIMPHYDTHFADLKVKEFNKIRMSSVNRRFETSYDQLWKGILTILTQYAIIAQLSYESGVISYIDIDGVLIKDKYTYMECPFTMLIEEEKGEKKYVVSVYPMMELYEGMVPTEEFKNLNDIFVQKGEEFLERLSVQLTTQHRWPWIPAVDR